MTDNQPESNTSKFQAWEGSSAFVQQGHHWSSAFIWLTAALFGCSFLWLLTAKLDQTISVRGQLQPSGSVREIESPTTGVVFEVFFKEGDTVNVGDSLLTVEAKSLTGQRIALQENLQLLELEAKSLQAIIASNGNPQDFGSPPVLPTTSDIELRNKMFAARNQAEQFRSQLRQLSIRLDSKQESLDLQSQIAGDLKPLFESGGLARNRYLDQLNSLQELRAEVATLYGERDRIVGIMSGRLNNINRQKITLKSQIVANLEAISYTTIKAPVSGTIFDLKTSISSFVTNSEKLLKIVPNNRLIANVEIPNSDIGFVSVGLPVSVAVDSFPSGEFGYITGVLESFGSDILPPDRDSPVQYFPAKITLNEQTVLSGDKELNLQSGMGITANVKLRTRRAISIITDLFTKQFDGLKRFR